MDKFRYVTIITLTVIFTAFVGNTYYLVSLYDSIKSQYIATAKDCLMQADFMEITKRLKDKYQYNDSNLIVNFMIVLDKRLTMDGDIIQVGNNTATESSVSDDDLFSMFEAMSTTMTHNLRNRMPSVDKPQTDFKMLEILFEKELNHAGLFPTTVKIIPEDSIPSFSTKNMWRIDYSLYRNSPVIYRAYISPPLGGILKETIGAVITTFIIFITLCFSFYYLIKTIMGLRTVEEMKDDFTNNMTHELKTPIAAAYSAIDTLIDRGGNYDNNKRERYLKLALDQLTRLSGLVESILSMSMERRKSLVLEHVDIDIKPFIDEIASLHTLKSEKNVNINVDVSPDDLVIKTDPTHFANVINNLLDNAIKYSGDSVTIDISINRNSLIIRDNGIGIPSTALPNIYKKFYRVPNGNCSEVSGYGIGLYYVKSIVDKMKWSVTAKSTLGKGTTFIINFSNNEE